MNVNSIRKKTPELISNEIQSIIDSESNGHTVTMINFWHQHRDLADVVSNKFEQQKINAVHFSLHDLPDIEIFRKQVKPVKAIVELSADTHDLSIGKKIGRGKYSMDEMEHFIDKLADDVYFFEIYFMIGLPYQSKNSVLETVAYCDYLMNKYKKNRNVIPYICPMLPFLDPGSEAAEKPETFGITLFHKTIEDHRKALTNLNWKYRLNFETSQMSRSELVDVSYEAVKKLTIIKNSYGLLPDCISNQITTLIDSTCELLNEIQLFESLTDEEQKTDFEIKIKEKVLAYNDEIFKKVRSQQRPLDFGFAKRQWFDTDDAINKILKTSMN
jgi:clorobiocin biosynthesis protein CloN6